FLPRLGDANDDAGAPAAVAAFERGAHHLGIAGRIERIVRAAVGQLEDLGDDLIARHALRIQKVGHAELLAPFLASGIDIDANDPVRADHPGALDDVEADAAETEHDYIRARFD